MLKPDFSPVAMEVLKARYLWKLEGGTQETPNDMFWRVANSIAIDPIDAQAFHDEMTALRFLPNSPTLMNAGKPAPHGQLSACYVVGLEDNMQSICEALRKQMLIHKSGGGTGFDFTPLRAQGAKVNTTNGVASGPVSFMQLFDTATEVVQQGGMRRGANMGILSVHHPDINKFIDAKVIEGKFKNFNISVKVDDTFMQAIADGTATDEQEILFAHIIDSAWKSGDPALIFIDTINKHNPTPELGDIQATNPCGETPLYANEACNLGSINLSHFFTQPNFAGAVPSDYIDWQQLERTIRIAVRFLDRVIDINQYPLPEIDQACKRTRKVGLGVMGWADLLIRLGIRYGSKESLALADEVMSFINRTAPDESVQMNPRKTQKNATLTCIAPTGTLSMLAGCSSGIEPNFAYQYTRLVLGEKVDMLHPLYQDAVENDWYDPDIFQTAFSVTPQEHVAMQAAFQKHTDLAVSKTVNLPSTATHMEIADIYISAWQQGCKGISVYRDKCKSEQVLSTPDNPNKVCPECQITL